MTRIDLPYTNGAPILPITVGANMALVYSLANAGRTPPSPIRCNLLIDSGAEDSFINQAIINSLNVQPTNSIPIQTGVPNSSPVNFTVYDLHIRIDPTFIGDLAFRLPSHQILASGLPSGGYDGLLGRDILSFGTLTLDGLKQKFRLVFP